MRGRGPRCAVFWFAPCSMLFHLSMLKKWDPDKGQNMGQSLMIVLQDRFCNDISLCLIKAFIAYEIVLCGSMQVVFSM